MIYLASREPSQTGLLIYHYFYDTNKIICIERIIHLTSTISSRFDVNENYFVCYLRKNIDNINIVFTKYFKQVFYRRKLPKTLTYIQDESELPNILLSIVYENISRNDI
jgi:hypothetical protein